MPILTCLQQFNFFNNYSIQRFRGCMVSTKRIILSPFTKKRTIIQRFNQNSNSNTPAFNPKKKKLFSLCCLICTSNFHNATQISFFPKKVDKFIVVLAGWITARPSRPFVKPSHEKAQANPTANPHKRPSRLPRLVPRRQTEVSGRIFKDRVWLGQGHISAELFGLATWLSHMSPDNVALGDRHA